MKEPMRSAFEFTMLFGGLGIWFIGIYFLDTTRNYAARAGYAIMAITGMVMLFSGLVMALVDILFYGYK